MFSTGASDLSQHIILAGGGFVLICWQTRIGYDLVMSRPKNHSTEAFPHCELDENGVDLSLIRENLKLTPEQRLLRAERARRNAGQLIEYGRRKRREGFYRSGELVFTAKQLLLKQTAEAFRGRADMPLIAALEGITQEEADWKIDEGTPTIEQIVRHVAWAKSRFCQQGFGTGMVLDDPGVNQDGDCEGLPWEFPCGAGWGMKSAGGIAEAIKLLEKAHRVLTECLESCTDEALERPIPTHHGKTAANFFWIMIMHDIYHAGQIRTRRTIYRAIGAK
jgi:uncharacterized damage-inducible protein DinB